MPNPASVIRPAHEPGRQGPSQQYPRTLRDRWMMWRNGLLLKERFQYWARHTPLIRRIARRKATALHHLTAGFVYSQVLAALVELEVLEAISQSPKSLEGLAQALDYPVDGLSRLLQAGRALGLLTRLSTGEWIPDELGAAMLGNPGVAAMVRHHRALYRDLEDPVALFRHRGTTHLSAYWPYALNGHTNDQEVQRYSTLMAESQQLISDSILRAYPFSKHRHLLDVGGGVGAFAHAAITHQPDLRVTIMDLPDVVSAAPPEHSERVSFVPGNMFETELPKIADIVSLVRVLHDHDDAPVQALLSGIYQALPEGGVLLIAEPMADTPGAEAFGDAYFGTYLWAMGSGRPRSAAEISTFCRQAGFSRCEEHPSAMPALVRVLAAHKTKV